MDADLDGLSREQLVMEVTRLREGIRRHRDSQPVSALVLEIADGVIQTIDLIANPDKLAGLRR